MALSGSETLPSCKNKKMCAISIGHQANATIYNSGEEHVVTAACSERLCISINQGNSTSHRPAQDQMLCSMLLSSQVAEGLVR